MLKTRLKFLAAISAVSLASSSVVSCGITAQRLMTRLNDVNTFKFTYLYPLTSWSTGITMQAEDGRYLNNLQGTLMTNDQFGRIVGDLIDDSKIESNSDSTSWDFEFKEGAYWFDAFGNKQRQIVGQDMLNTAFYVLNNRSISETSGLWETFVKGATELKEKLNGIKGPDGNFIVQPATPEEREVLMKSFEGIKLYDDNPRKFTFNLAKGVPYFKTVITYTAFSPLPDKAIDENNPRESYYNYGKNWRVPWYSGAYLVKNYEPTSQIALEKNQNYVNSSDVHINRLEYTYLKNADVSRNRILFESGDSSEAIIAPNDSAGWNKYVGKDAANPIFEGATSQVSPDPTTFNFTMNLANVDQSDMAKKANLAITTKSVRALLSNFLNRSLYAKFYSDALDSDETSSFLRNVYTARRFVLEDDGTDYASYVEKTYQENVIENKVNSGSTSKSAADLLADGSDALQKNDQNLRASFNYSDPQENVTLETLFPKVKKDLSKVGLNERVKIPVLMNGNLSTTANIYLENMIDTFNSLKDNPIEIVKNITVDVTEYQTQLKKGSWNLAVSGWSPDYSDPSTYLNTYAIGGDLQGYTGTQRLAKFNYEGDKISEDFEFNKEFSYLSNSQEAIETVKNYISYTNKVSAADKITDNLKNRYKAFSEAEFDLIYRDYLLIPLYVPNGSYQVKLTYVKPFTQPLTPYGGSKYRFNYVELTPFLLTKRERDILAIRFEEQKRLINENLNRKAFK
ncbi:oligopeptide ABC transporter substrate-binding protein [Spiroplasma sabaudiense Ar-1343]|uniref:Oligopeptide ABC transporter substrate-binding protein n=1 Tax=Spiroplasma sabaudiense Ar-1343 TaxID=1276257 RepID=W6AAV8_9MOLU|nr:ABC transporter substrate-binding protein [Spiroplasma sabaudiense]AHI54182.1 oligopeptide ABC transporter substrate-binding protein [Spiroplasma sabaudiense Ar-1343]